MQGTHRWWAQATLGLWLIAQSAYAQTNAQPTNAAVADSAAAPPVVTTAATTRVERYRLRNGLDVMLEPRSTGSSVTVALYVRAGTSDQPHGYTGLAHLTEHLMFARTVHHPQHLVATFEAMGATAINGLTGRDSTFYYETIPATQLQRALWIESERLGYSLPALTSQILLAQKDVVRNEDGERMSGPRAQLIRASSEQLYPRTHPYFESTEYADDLDAISLAHVQWFHQRFYRPSNVTLVVVGAFDTSEARRWIEQYFAPIQGDVAHERAAPVAAAIDSERSVTVEARVRSERLEVTWITAPLFTEDDAALDLIASILADSAMGRLPRRLVDSLDVAQGVSARQASGRLSSEFSIVVQCTEEHDGSEALSAIDAELARLQMVPVSDAELAAAKRLWIADVLRTRDDITARAGQLAQFSDWSATEPDMTEREIARYQAVTPQQILRVARTALSRGHRVVARLRRAPQPQRSVALADSDSSSTQRAAVEPGGRR